MNEKYRSILASLPPGLEKKVFSILADHHVGKSNRLSRFTLVQKAFPVALLSPTNQANSYEDRQVRRSIEVLQSMGYPILSSSGEGGYYLPADRSELDEYVRELESRIEKLTVKVRSLRTGNKLAWQEPKPVPVQEPLL